jgi:hypothetical protein
MYIQAADMDAFVYSGKYSEVVGKFAQHLCFERPMFLGLYRLKNVLLCQNKSVHEIAKIQNVMEVFLRNQHASCQERKDLLDILENYSVRMIPIQNLSLTHYDPFVFTENSLSRKQSVVVLFATCVCRVIDEVYSSFSFLVSCGRGIFQR